MRSAKFYRVMILDRLGANTMSSIPHKATLIGPIAAPPADAIVWIPGRPIAANNSETTVPRYAA